jgi:hypothetical protein
MYNKYSSLTEIHRQQAPEPVSELKTRSRAFMLDCSRCSLGIFWWGSRGHRGCNG